MLVSVHERYNRTRVYQHVVKIEQRGDLMVMECEDGIDYRVQLPDIMYAEITEVDDE